LPIVGYQDFYPLLTNVFQGHFFPGHSLLTALAKTIGSWRSYHFVPARMRQPLPLRKDLQLQSDGGNLPTVLLSLQAEHRDLFRQIVEILRSGVPELRELYAAFTGEGAAYISIEEQGFSQRIPAWAMSDGTLQLLAHLAVLYSPSPPALVCFEEPENFLHPHLLQLVADLFREASKRTQILVSTHSPYLLNFIDPDDLFIVEKSEGKTKVKPAHKKQDLKEALRVLGLGEMWYAGSLGGVPQ
jgi:predicted ATPase